MDETQCKELCNVVRAVAFKLWRRLPAHVEMDDLVSAGTEGLFDALDKFDPSRGVPLPAYVRIRARGAILDSLRTYDPISRGARVTLRRIERAYGEVEARLARPAVLDEVASEMGVSLAILRRWLRELGTAGLSPGKHAVTADRVVCAKAKKNCGIEHSSNPFTLVWRREKLEMASRAFAKLSKRLRLILKFYYDDALTMKEIAFILGLDESRISQLRTLAIRQLRDSICHMQRSDISDGRKVIGGGG